MSTDGDKTVVSDSDRWILAWFKPDAGWHRVAHGRSRLRALCVLLIAICARPHHHHNLRWAPPAEHYLVQKTDADGNWVDVPDASYDRASNNLRLPDTNDEPAQ